MKIINNTVAVSLLVFFLLHFVSCTQNVNFMKLNKIATPSKENYISDNQTTPDALTTMSNQINDVQKEKVIDLSSLYLSWFVFIPFVLLIFVMTVLSIIGFFVLILNASDPYYKKDLHPNLLLRGEHDLDILYVLRSQQIRRKRKKDKTLSSYQPEPEPDSVALNC